MARERLPPFEGAMFVLIFGRELTGEALYQLTLGDGERAVGRSVTGRDHLLV